MIRIAARFLSRYSHVNWPLADQSMVSGSNFLTGLLLARYLGLAEFGRFTLAWVAVLLIASVQKAIIISPMMTIGPKQPDDQRAVYYGAVAIQQLIFSGAAFVLVLSSLNIIAAVFPEWNTRELALPLSCVTFAFISQDFVRRMFFALGRPAAAFATDAVRYLGQLFLLYWFLKHVPLNAQGAIWIITGVAVLAIGVALLSRERLDWSIGVFRFVTIRHWHFGKWLLTSNLLGSISSNIFVLAAGPMLGTASVGALKAAQNILGVSHILFEALENFVPVRAVSHYRKSGYSSFRAYIQRVTLGTGSATLVISLLAAIAPDFWLSLAYGSDYPHIGYLVRWFAVFYFVSAFSLPVRIALRTIEETKSIFFANFAQAACALTLFWPLLQSFEISGAIYGLTLAMGIQVGVLYTGFRRHRAILA